MNRLIQNDRNKSWKVRPKGITRFYLLIFLTTLLVPIRTTLAQGIIYVDHTATGSNNGSNWENAFTDLQDALSAAVTGDEIWVADGVYKPGSPRTNSFALKSGVALYGGFAGGETSRSIRNGSPTVSAVISMTMTLWMKMALPPVMKKSWEATPIM